MTDPVLGLREALLRYVQADVHRDHCHVASARGPCTCDREQRLFDAKRAAVTALAAHDEATRCSGCKKPRDTCMCTTTLPPDGEPPISPGFLIAGPEKRR